MSDHKQSEGRRKNGAARADRPDPTTSDKRVKEVGKQSRRKAGPDGPDATVVGDTFKA